MAGIAGYINIENNVDDKINIENMALEIKHRGPDYSYRFKDNYLNITYLGLNIGHENEGQEFYENDNYYALLVGYLYNREQIEFYLGESNSNKSDIHLIFEGYMQGKDDFFSILDGNYIIIIWDKLNKELKVIRDSFGIQPFYYYEYDKGIIFASEIKAILKHKDYKRELNEEAIKPYLVFQSPSLEETFFKGVYRLEPAHMLTYKNKLTTKAYWVPAFNSEEKPLDDYINQIDKEVKKSIDEKTRLKKEVSSFLSGGVDSSYLAAVYRPEKTFTVGFSQENFSEIDNAQALSKIIESQNINEVVDKNKAMSELDKIQYMMDEPLSNPSVIPLYYLSKLAKENTDLVISGEGADEFFGGYFEYEEADEIKKYKKVPSLIRKSLGNIAKSLPVGFRGRNFLIKGGLEVEDYYIGQAKIFGEKEAESILNKAYKTSLSIKDITNPIFSQVEDYSDLTKKQYLDLHLWMPNDILLKADRMSMAHSLQVIMPLVTKDMFGIASQLPDEYKIDGNQVKKAFRLASLRNLPKEWANRKKIGFPVPIYHWIKEKETYNEIKETFNSSYSKEIFNTDKLNRLLEDHYRGKKRNQRKIWTVYMFLIWYKVYFIDDSQ